MASMPNAFNSRAFAGIPRNQPVDRNSQADYAQSLGYQIVGDTAVGRFAGKPTWTPLNAFTPPGVSAMDQAGAALGQDIDFLRENVQQPYQQATQMFFDSIVGGSQALTDASGKGVSLLEQELAGIGTGDDVASRIRGQAGGLDQVLSRLDKDLRGVERGARDSYQHTTGLVDDIVGNVDRQIGPLISKMLGFAEGAVSSAAGAVQGYDASASNTIRSYIAGFERRVDSQAKLVEAGINPETGLPLSPGEAQAYRRQLVQDTNDSIGRNVLAFKDQAQQFLAQLRTNLANVQLGAAGVAGQAAGLSLQGEGLKLAAGELGERAAARLDATLLGAAGQRAEAGIQVGQIKTQAEIAAGQHLLATRELRANLANSLAALYNTGAMQVASFKAQGLQSYADLIKNTPFVSMFEGIMSLLGLATSPGFSQIKGLNL